MLTRTRLSLLALAATVLISGSANALTLGAPSLVNSSTVANVGPTGVNSAQRGSVSGTNTVTPTNGTTATTRYHTTGGQDVGTLYSNGTILGTTMNANYTITFSVTHTNGQGYFINIGSSLVGVLTGDNEGPATTLGTAAVGPVSGSRTGGGTLFGSLGLAGTTTLGAYTTAGTNTAISRSGSATIFNTGTGAAQVYTLTFTFTANAQTPQSFFDDLDDTAFRLGLATSTGSVASNPTTDDYGGIGGRNGLNDGHFVTIALAIPEPGTLLLLGAGTAGLALIGRKRA